jgi:hypothetical protein
LLDCANPGWDPIPRTDMAKTIVKPNIRNSLTVLQSKRLMFGAPMNIEFQSK